MSQQSVYPQPSQQYDPRFNQTMQAPPVQQTRKPRRWPWIIALIVVFIVGFGTGQISKTDDATSATQISSTQTTTNQRNPTASVPQTSSQASTTNQHSTTSSTPQNTSQAAPAQKWTTTHTFSGNGAKKTETFSVPDDWKISYSCQGMSVDGTSSDAVLQVMVYGQDGTLQDMAVNTTCAANKTTTDTTEEHQSGQVYLDINATSNWAIAVQESK